MAMKLIPSEANSPLKLLRRSLPPLRTIPDLDSAAHEHHPLAGASLVSHEWNSICRPHVFRKLSISSWNTSDRLHFLHFDAPHLSEYIRIVRLWLDDEVEIFTALEWYPECFGRLKNVHTLHLDHGISSSSKEQELLATSISSMLAAPCLRKLVLCGWEFSMGGSDFLAMLPPTLEVLILDIVSVAPESAEAATQKSTTLRLEALRVLELQAVFHPMLRSQNFIECPNLERLTARWYPIRYWYLPPWIPDTLSELVLHARPDGDIPHLGTTIQPSVVTIELSGGMSYSEIFVWVKDCIAQLSFPNCIRTLTLNILNEQSDCEALYPTPSEYEVLSSFLLQLYKGGGLQRITLNITAAVDSRDEEFYVDEARELAKLETGFPALLQGNLLDVYCISESIDDEQRIVHCSIQRTEIQ